jgi:hypothetical protein
MVVLSLGGDGALRVKVAGDGLRAQRHLHLFRGVTGQLRVLGNDHGHHLPYVG